MAENFGNALISLLPNLRRYALSLCRSGDLADDLVQTTCEKAFANQSSFQSGTRLDAWLFRILRNTWLDSVRKQKFETQPDDADDIANVPDPDAGNIAETRLLLRRVSDLIEQLPESQREVILLVCVEELSYKEAAGILDIPVGTVMSRLARARQQILTVAGIK